MMAKRTDFTYLLFTFVVVLMSLRLLSLGTYPLMDTTEARYAEIARKMLELNDWITPWFDYDVPFWGKPPLSFWVTALSFKVFGINEFAARLPHFACGVYLIWFVYQWAAALHSHREAAYTAVVLSGSLLYFVASGCVMTDIWLLLGTTLSMRAFWSSTNRAQTQKNYEKWLFFIGLAIGLLSKGPIALILTGLPIFVWIVVSGKYRVSWQSLPWIRGGLLTMLISVPWYIVAEIMTPGFLDYFLIGEHFQRFVVSGWQGDLYGSAHQRPMGSIWLMMVIDALPWSLLVPSLFVFLWRKNRLVKVTAESKEWRLYLLLWGLMPAVFFTFAGNILWTYVLTGFPALALWISFWLNQQTGVEESIKVKFLLGGSFATLTLVLLVAASFTMGELSERRSLKSLVQLYNDKNMDNVPLLYYGKRRFSADFYSHGTVDRINDLKKLEERILSGTVFVAIESSKINRLSNNVREALKSDGVKGDYNLFHSSGAD